MLTLSCNEINNKQKAVEIALGQFKKGIVVTTMAIYNQKKKLIEGDPYSDNIQDVITWIDNENKINDDSEIKDIRNRFLDIARRLNNCIN